jgi:tRNA nucleotidyltransferase (CCA-adding enzyme)
MALMEVLPPRAVGETVKRLGMSARDAARIKAGHAAANAVLRRLAKRPLPKPSDAYHALDGLADETLLFLMARAKPDSVKRQVSAYLTIYQRTRPLLTGDDLKSLGLKPGPLYKRILGRLLDARLDGNVKSEADERELVKKFVRA